jgi:hypothetical protein
MKSSSESEDDILWAVEDRGFQISKTDNIVGAPYWRAHRHHQLSTTKIPLTMYNNLYTTSRLRLVVVGTCGFGGGLSSRVLKTCNFFCYGSVLYNMF